MATTTNSDQIIDTGPDPLSAVSTQMASGAGYWGWAYLVGVLALYVPLFIDAGKIWFTNENYAHGVLILPVCAFLVWLRRAEIATAPKIAYGPGLIVLAIGLAIKFLAYFLVVRYLGLWSFALVAMGSLLALYGRSVWKIVSFPVFFALFAGPLPFAFVGQVTRWIQTESSIGAGALMQLLGYPIIRTGNLIDVPGITLEVADVCSGFHKLIALVAFSLLYGYLYHISMAKRLVLLAVAVPIAVIANILRISALIAVTVAGGVPALHQAHDLAEVVALVLAFALFSLVGRALGCKVVRFSL